MEAKDTVMDILEILKRKYLASRTNPKFEQLSGLGKLDAQDIAIAEAQAEISFKVGQQEEREKAEKEIADTVAKAIVSHLAPLLEKSKKAGIREVVEWIQGNCACFSPDEQEKFVIEGWQAKLKDWGL